MKRSFRSFARVLLPAIGLALAWLPQQAAAQEYPTKPVRYVVPFPPGGLTDVMARNVGQKLGEKWKQPVVVDNRAGGNAQIGAELVAKAPGDGYTLLAVTLTHAVNATLFPAAPYSLQKDLTPVAVLGSLPLMIVVNANSPYKTLADLIAAGKTKSLNGGSSGNGTPPHLGPRALRAGGEDQCRAHPLQGRDAVAHRPHGRADRPHRVEFPGVAAAREERQAACARRDQQGAPSAAARRADDRRARVPAAHDHQLDRHDGSCDDRRRRSSPRSTPTPTRRWPNPR